MAGFMEKVFEKNAYEMGMAIISQAGIMNEVCQDSSPENISRKENIEELVNGMNDFCTQRLEEGNDHIRLDDFLSEVSLLTDQDSDSDEGGEKITLMTVHSAKGLEFKNVFVVGMEENLFPSGMAGDSPRALEEERRLFYVAITRAEEHCFLSYAKTRIRYGKMEFGNPSRFLRDIDARFLRLPQDAALRRKVDEEAGNFRAAVRRQLITPTVPKNLTKVPPADNVKSPSPVAASSVSSTSAYGLETGMFIVHERFGRGEVMRVEGEGENAKATIHFQNAGEKQLLLRFARFKIVES